MALSEEWKHRIEVWEKALWKYIYRPLGDIELSGFTTQEHLTHKQAIKHTFLPMPEGTLWGAKWEYGWFRCSMTLSDEAEKRRIVLRIDPLGKDHPYGESLVWVNGDVTGSFGWARKDITLTKDGRQGQSYDILLEAYSGHGLISIGDGPIRFGEESVPEPGPTQAVVGSSSFGIWLEEVYQLALDFTTLFDLRNRLDSLSLRVSEIDQGLMESSMLVDLELPENEMLPTVIAARERLKPLLACTNGSTSPTFFSFGHAHIDIAWLWPLAETERKMARTIANQLALMQEYPEYRFLQSQPQLYSMLKVSYPELYKQFKTAILAGKAIPDGAMWVEADTNITGGESLIRQILHGRRFFLEEFGVDSRVLWLPDVFGYSGSLPQILRGCGCFAFATQKITWAYNGGDLFPYNTFLWEGIDGTTIPAHIFSDYNSQTRPGNILDRWNTRLQKNGISTMILAFGWGDGGGGPTRDHIEFLGRAADLEGLPHVRISSPAEFFADLDKKGLPIERYVGELYFQAHRGTYTSQAKTKQGNRRSEFALHDAEIWGTAARAIKGFDFSTTTLNSAWKKLLLNQFHDILPGSSIHRVYQEAEASFGEVVAEAEMVARSAVSTFLDDSDAVSLFNSLSWPRRTIAELPEGPIEVTIPSCGWITIQRNGTVYEMPSEDGVALHSLQTANVHATDRPAGLENEFLRAQFNERGELVSLFDKETNRELMDGPGNRFFLYRDVPTMWDAWDIDSMTEQMPVDINEPVTIEDIASGPLVGRIKLTRKLHHSTLSQIISLRRGSRSIEFATALDWLESHKLLKVAFPMNIHTNEAIHEIQFGHLRRPNHRSRPYDADRFEVCNQKWSALAEENRGVAILNDSKYGLSVLGNSINLTLLKSAMAPDMSADLGVQAFTYALYSWNGSFADSNVVREAYELNCPIMVFPGASGQGSLYYLDEPNIILETVKPAEDGSNDIVLRLYECKRMATRCHLRTSLPVKAVIETDMCEVGKQELECDDGNIKLDFRPFEIKTLRMKVN